jgi:cell division protein FtsQ
VVLAAVGLALTRTGLFRVQSIEVEGHAHLSRSEVVRLSGITRKDNAVWLDRVAAEERLDRDPWIAHAEVHVDLPWTVTMTLTERSPIAVLHRPGTEMLVAADGTILGPGRANGLPVIDAPPTWIDAGGTTSVRDAAAALSALDPELREMVRKVFVGTPGGLELLWGEGLRVSFGPARDFEEKARVLREVLAWIDRTGERIRAVDVSAPSAPAITPVA